MLSAEKLLKWSQEVELHGWSSANKMTQAAVLGESGDYVLFTVQFYPTCYRRGPYRLLIQVYQGPNHHLWGCFDDQDQPMRYFHSIENLKSEAELIARVLLTDRVNATSLPPMLPERSHGTD